MGGRSGSWKAQHPRDTSQLRVLVAPGRLWLFPTAGLRLPHPGSPSRQTPSTPIFMQQSGARWHCLTWQMVQTRLGVTYTGSRLAGKQTGRNQRQCPCHGARDRFWGWRGTHAQPAGPKGPIQGCDSREEGSTLPMPLHCWQVLEPKALQRPGSGTSEDDGSSASDDQGWESRRRRGPTRPAER